MCFDGWMERRYPYCIPCIASEKFPNCMIETDVQRNQNKFSTTQTPQQPRAMPARSRTKATKTDDICRHGRTVLTTVSKPRFILSINPRPFNTLLDQPSQRLGLPPDASPASKRPQDLWYKPSNPFSHSWSASPTNPPLLTNPPPNLPETSRQS